MGVSYVEKQYVADAEHAALTKPIIPENLDRKAFLIMSCTDTNGMVRFGIKANGGRFYAPSNRRWRAYTIQ